MRGNKRRAAAVATAANKPQPALNDAILDVANRKGVRCCVECGATSTPQWREGPMGPKTLCNACGVRRQRLLRKQQAATSGNIPTAPVAAVQARRRLLGRSMFSSSPLESDDMPFGAASGSEHSSDETEFDWTTGMPAKRQHQHQHPKEQQHEEQQLIAPVEVEESCNEDESAAYDLLFFAGVECGSGCGLPSTDPPPASCWRSEQQHHHHHHGHHGHNTRRHVQPLRRSDDFYYYEEGEEASDGAEDDRCKRHRMSVSPPSEPLSVRPRSLPYHHHHHQHHHQHHHHVVTRQVLLGSSPLSSTEDAAESGLASVLAKASDDIMQQQQQQQQQQQGERDHPYGGHRQLLSSALISDLRGAAAVVGPLPATTAPSPPFLGGSSTSTSSSPLTLPALAAPTLLAPGAAAFTRHPTPSPFSIPLALPVLPLSLPLPMPMPVPSMAALPAAALSAKDLEMLAKLRLDFQRACLQLHHANVACEAVGAVVAERRQAAASAHEQAEAASQMLASEAKAMVDRYRLRDVLAELHSATSAERSAPVATLAAAEEEQAAVDNTVVMQETQLPPPPQQM